MRAVVSSMLVAMLCQGLQTVTYKKPLPGLKQCGIMPQTCRRIGKNGHDSKDVE